VAAEVAWEDLERPEQTLYFEAPAPFARDLDPSPDSFVLASLPFAVWLGERRLRVEGSICTRLRDGLQAAIEIYALWYDRCGPLRIEPEGGFVPVWPRSKPRTACFLSGGVDGLAALRANRLDYPRDHPDSIRDCLLLFGANNYEFDAAGPVAERLAAFERLEGRLAGLAESEAFELIPIHTNARLLCPSYQCWTSIGFGAANTAVAHAFSRRFTKVIFASDGAGVDPLPGASHPLLDQHYSSAALHVHHEHATMSRLEKLRLLTEWKPAMEFMQPCHYIEVPRDGWINCGRCEKCIRTMLMLLALGKLKEASAFADDDVTPEMVDAIPIRTRLKAELLEQCLAPLERIGRGDLVEAIRRKTERFRSAPRSSWRRRAGDLLRGVTRAGRRRRVGGRRGAGT
jgi:ferredoxin